MKMKRIAAAISVSVFASLAAVMPMSASADGNYGENALLKLPVKAADGYSDMNGTQLTADITTLNTTQLKKILEIEDGANIPACSFTMTASAGKAADSTADTLPVLAGVHPEKIVWNVVKADGTADNSVTTGAESTNIAYVANQVTLGENNAATGAKLSADTDNVVITDGNSATYFAEKAVQLDFSGCGFTEPGIYRYIITETQTADSANTGITNDTAQTRTIDVYVEDASYYTRTVSSAEGADPVTYSYSFQKKLKIAGCVMYVGTQEAGPAKTGTAGTETTLEDNTSKVTPNGHEVANAVKSVGFKNSYTTHDLTFNKTVTGNQGSKDKYFKFTVAITGAVAGTVYDVDLTDADEKTGSNEATLTDYREQDNSKTITVGTDGTVSQDFYLQHGQQIVIKGLAEGTGYTITENAEDYTADAAISGDTKTNDGKADEATIKLTKNAMTDSYIQADTVIAFTNDRSGIIPTGIISTVAGSVGIVALGIAGFAGGMIYLKKKKSEDE